jgi:hypothetical protein
MIQCIEICYFVSTTPDSNKFIFEIYSRVSILMNTLYLFIFVLQLTEQSTEITAAICHQYILSR